MKNIYLTLSLILAFSTLNAQNKKTKAADKLFKNYKYVEAASEYLKLTKSTADDTYVSKQLGDCYYNFFNSIEAEKWYAIAIASEQDPETYFRYGQMLKANKKYAEASIQMKKFASLAPNDKRAMALAEEESYLKKLFEKTKTFDIKTIPLNSKYSDFGGYLKDNTLYFSSARNTENKKYDWNAQPFLDIYQTDFKDGNASADSKAVVDLNTKYHEGPLTISADGNTMYFSRESFFDNKYQKADDKTKFSKMFIYKATKTDGKWGNITSTSINSDQFNNSSPSLSKDGQTLYFSSDRPGSIGKNDIYKTTISADGTISEATNLGEKVNTEGTELFPFIADNNTLYFSSNGKMGFGGLDVFSLDLNKSGDALNLGMPVNSEKDDFGFTFNQVQNVAFLSSNRDGGQGDDDIYQATPICYLDVMVLVRDEKTNSPLADATVTLVDENKNVVGKATSNSSGSAVFRQECDKKLFANIEKDGYTPNTFPVDKTKGETTINTSIKPIEIPPPVITETEVILNNINFDFDQSYITAQGAAELDRLVQVMNDHPTFIIFAKSHTDFRGNDDYNMLLSDRRAKSTVAYVVSKGIAAERISGQGYGESEPKVACVKCTEEEHFTNRRSEFFIVKK
jgi:outer membrane protein OmpA-like peptidoglycan-associated protein/tetratricopeptide (TPR) repeat protein